MSATVYMSHSWEMPTRKLRFIVLFVFGENTLSLLSCCPSFYLPHATLHVKCGLKNGAAPAPPGDRSGVAGVGGALPGRCRSGLGDDSV